MVELQLFHDWRFLVVLYLDSDCKRGVLQY
jgi:hypothetical protein